ncbi:MAG: Holliday junction resolvase RuvX [Planctomycetes bacterium]|nr:Holliday junction resolvase RuvX [Planctomycetota bacterium]
MRYLAIDYGLKRTGLAICDAGEIIACPLEVVATGGGLIPKIVDIVGQEEIDAIVMGLPLNMDDSEGPQAKLVRRIARQIEDAAGVPIHFQDERLSSFEAEKKLSGVGLTRKGKKKRLDAIAAAEILQCFLDEKAG